MKTVMVHLSTRLIIINNIIERERSEFHYYQSTSKCNHLVKTKGSPRGLKVVPNRPENGAGLQ